MKNFLFAWILLLTTESVGQIKDPVRYKKLRVGIIFSPDHCYRSLKYHTSNKNIMDRRNSEEVPLFGYTLGMGLRRELGKSLLLESGLQYSRKGAQTQYAELLWSDNGPEYPAISNTQYRFSYLEIPLRIHYHYDPGRLRYSASAGIAFSTFISKQSRVDQKFADGRQTSGKSSVNAGYSRFNLAAIVSLGIHYDLTERMTISLEPVYRRFINSIVADPYTREYPYSLGLNTGAYFKLRKK